MLAEGGYGHESGGFGHTNVSYDQTRAPAVGDPPARAPSGPFAGCRVPRHQRIRVVLDEWVDKPNDIGDEIDPPIGWSQREGGPPAQRVVAALPVGQLDERLGERENRMPAVLGDGLKGRA